MCEVVEIFNVVGVIEVGIKIMKLQFICVVVYEVGDVSIIGIIVDKVRNGDELGMISSDQFELMGNEGRFIVVIFI